MSTSHRTENGGSVLSLEQWREVKAVVQAALELAPRERSAFVDGACGTDQVLRREVESLLAAADGDDRFLESPAIATAGFAAPSLYDESDSLMPMLAEALGDQFAFERELDRGGMSRVFLAVERALARQVVVKVLRPDLVFGASAVRFAREVRLAARLQQANIVPVLSAGELRGIPYYTMPYVRGDSLRALLASGVEMTTADALGILKDVAKALAFAHAEGVVHRDIKPENVLLSGGTAVVTDFGIAKAITVARNPENAAGGNETITNEGSSIGTPAYMSPEQAVGDPHIEPASDIYSFGVVAYELLSEVHPFAGKRGARELMAAHAIEQPRPLADVRPALPARVAALVMRCLAKDPADRPANGTELVAALEDAESSSSGAFAPWDADTPSIAVLPFENLSADPENEYFSDGITAEVLSALTRVRGLRVAARTSSFAFKGQSTTPRAIAGRLGVKSVLEGSVRRIASRVRITVQLVSAADGLTLWTERYDRELSDIFAVQDEIAQAIALALERTLASGARAGVVAPTQPPARREVVNADAFELYLRGRQLLEQRAEGMREALHCFEEALRLAPDFSRLHAGIAYAYNLFGVYHGLRAGEAFPRAREAADRALVLDPTDALALVMRAHVALWHEWDLVRAEALARRALELAPGLHLAHGCVGLVSAASGRFEDAIAAMQRACELDPLSQYAAYDLAWVLILAGRWEQAIRELQPAVARHPQASELRRAFGFCLFYAGRLPEARAEFERVLELSVGDRWGSPNYAQMLAALGETDQARRLLREIEQRAPHEPIPPLGIAILHHWLGDDDAAFEWLERSLAARDSWLIMLRFDPSMLRLRSDPRFASVIQRVHPGARY